MNNALSKIQCPEFVLFYDREASRTYILTQYAPARQQCAVSVFSPLEAYKCSIQCVYGKKRSLTKKGNTRGERSMLLSSAKVVTPYRTLSNELTSKRQPPPHAAPVLSDVRCHTALTTNAAQGWRKLWKIRLGRTVSHDNFLQLLLFSFLKIIKY